MPIPLLKNRSSIFVILFLTIGIVLFLACIPHNAQTPTAPTSSILPSSTVAEKAQLVIATSSSSTPEFLINSEAWKAVRNELLKPENCFMGREEYCIRDSEFVNKVMKEYIGRYEEYYNKSFTREELLGIAGSLKVNYDRAVQSPDGLKRLELLLQNRYEHPIIIDQGSTVGIDMGALPSTLNVTVRRGIVMSSSTHWNDSKRWKTEEWMKIFDEYQKKYPQARRIHLVSYFPYLYGQPSKWEYIYDLSTDRIILLHPGTFQGVMQSRSLGRDLTPYIQGDKKMELYFDLKYIRVNPGYYPFDFSQE